MTSSTLTVDAATGEVLDVDGPLADQIAAGGELFDPKPFTIPVPTLDGHRADWTIKHSDGEDHVTNTIGLNIHSHETR